MLSWDSVVSRAKSDPSQAGKRKREVVDGRGGLSHAAGPLQPADIVLPEHPSPTFGSDLREGKGLQPTTCSASQKDSISGFIDQLIEASMPSEDAQMGTIPTPPPAGTPNAAASSACPIEPLGLSSTSACDEIAAMHQSPLINPAVATNVVMQSEASQLVYPGELHYSPDADFQIACHMDVSKEARANDEPPSKKPRILLRLREPKPQLKRRVKLRLTKPRKPSTPQGKRCRGRTQG